MDSYLVVSVYLLQSLSRKGWLLRIPASEAWAAAIPWTLLFPSACRIEASILAATEQTVSFTLLLSMELNFWKTLLSKGRLFLYWQNQQRSDQKCHMTPSLYCRSVLRSVVFCGWSSNITHHTLFEAYFITKRLHILFTNHTPYIHVKIIQHTDKTSDKKTPSSHMKSPSKCDESVLIFLARDQNSPLKSDL